MSSNETWIWAHEEIVMRYVAVICMCILNASVIFGNGILIVAIMTSKCLRRPTYYFIASLTVSDLAVGIFVLPFFIDLLNQNAWIFGQFLCRFWTGAHVFLCTASIYNLIAIAADRMLAVTWPLTYKAIMTPLKVKSVIAFVWLGALGVTLMSLVPMWSSEISQDLQNVTTNVMVTCSMKIYRSSYAISSMSLSFYFPTFVLVCAYICIYRTTRRVKLSQKLGQLDVVSIGSAGSLAGSSAGSVGYPIGCGSRSGSIVESKAGSGGSAGAGTTSTTAFDELSVLMRPRLKSPGLLRIHKGRYHKSSISSADQPTTSMADSQPLPRLTRRLQTIPSVGLSVFLASPRRSISELALPGDDSSSIGWKKRNREGSNGGASVKSEPINPCVEGTKSWIRIEHDFWFRMAIQRKRLSARLNSAWAPRKSAIQRYQQKLSFELRALKTFAIVTVCFLMCWVGFCMVNTYDLISPSCGWTTVREDGAKNGCAPEWALKMVTALGYVNSALNPFIYGISNRNFRAAFKRMLKLGCWK